MKTIRYLKERIKSALSSEEMPLNERLDIYGEVDRELDEYKQIIMQTGLGYNDEVDDYEYLEVPNQYEKKYKELEQAYRDRFFNDGTNNSTEDEEKKETYDGLDDLLDNYRDEEDD